MRHSLEAPPGALRTYPKRAKLAREQVDQMSKMRQSQGECNAGSERLPSADGGASRTARRNQQSRGNFVHDPSCGSAKPTSGVPGDALRAYDAIVRRYLL